MVERVTGGSGATGSRRGTWFSGHPEVDSGGLADGDPVGSRRVYFVELDRGLIPQ